jgi:Protein of unknown function (DUF2742)
VSAIVSSQQVSWWDVHLFTEPLLTKVGSSWPMAGSPEWCALPDGDPAKLAAIYDAARHWALRVETCQQAECEASHAISAAADWSAHARAWLSHNEFYAEKPWMRRRAAS